MRLAVLAWRLRQTAHQALNEEEYERALALASQAQQLHATPSGESLRVLTAWLNAH